MKNAIIFSTALFLTLCSCEEDSAVDQQSPASTITNGLTGLTDGYLDSDAFALEDVRLIGTVLQLDVAYGGGCEEHEFYIVWPEIILAIYPPEFDIYVAHDANGDMCEAYLRETLEIDISDNPLQIDAAALAIAKLGVVNTSNPDQTFYPNE